MRITDIIWKERFVEKLAVKHQVSTYEAEQVLFGKPFIVKVAKGHVQGEDVYQTFGQTHTGRYLIVVFVKKGIAAIPISARDMTRAERSYYEKHK